MDENEANSKNLGQNQASTSSRSSKKPKESDEEVKKKRINYIFSKLRLSDVRQLEEHLILDQQNAPKKNEMTKAQMRSNRPKLFDAKIDDMEVEEPEIVQLNNETNFGDLLDSINTESTCLVKNLELKCKILNEKIAYCRSSTKSTNVVRTKIDNKISAFRKEIKDSDNERKEAKPRKDYKSAKARKNVKTPSA